MKLEYRNLDLDLESPEILDLNIKLKSRSLDMLQRIIGCMARITF